MGDRPISLPLDPPCLAGGGVSGCGSARGCGYARGPRRRLLLVVGPAAGLVGGPGGLDGPAVVRQLPGPMPVVVLPLDHRLMKLEPSSRRLTSRLTDAQPLKGDSTQRGAGLVCGKGSMMFNT